MSNLEDYNHIGLLFPSAYLSGPELRGESVDVTIKAIEPRHELKRSDDTIDHKPVVTLVEYEKKWVMNKTNGQTIADIYGPEAMNWIGKRVTLFAKKVKAFGKVHDAIRVKPRAPVAKKVSAKLTQVLKSIGAAPDKATLENVGKEIPAMQLGDDDKAAAKVAYRTRMAELGGGS